MQELELTIGKTTIPYRVIESGRLSYKRLILSSEYLEVRVPKGVPVVEIEKFLYKKEQWIVQNIDELRSKIALNIFPQHFYPGSKIMIWGRYVRFEFKRCAGINKVKAFGSSPIYLQIPEHFSWNEGQEEIVSVVMSLLKEKLKCVINKFIQKHSHHISGLKSWNISHSADKWGYCTKDGKLYFNWQLVCCPKSVVEYVVVHELAHLIHRSHNSDFWCLVSFILPHYETQKLWLAKEGTMLGFG